MTGWAVRDGKKIGFGQCEGTVLPALDESEYYWSLYQNILFIYPVEYLFAKFFSLSKNIGLFAFQRQN